MYTPSKKHAAGIFLGADIYIVTLIASELVYSVYISAAQILMGVSADRISEASERSTGILLIMSTFSALMISAVYYGYINFRYAAFGDTSAKNRTLSGTFKTIIKKNRPVGAPALIISMMIVMAGQVAAVIAEIPAEYVLNLFGFTMLQSPAATFDYTMNLSMILYSVVLGPIVEETVFRGFVLRGLMPYGKSFAITVSALAFSLMHGDISQLFYTFIIGLLLAYTAVEYSIFVSFFLHVFNNGFIGLLMPWFVTKYPEFIVSVLYERLFLLVTVLTVIFLIKNASVIKAYFRENAPREGSAAALKNKWFIIYAVIGSASALLTISPF